MKYFLSELKQTVKESKYFDKAYALAKKAHAGQKDLAGKPYIKHIEAVIKNVSHLGDDVKTVAALHDILEDTHTTEEDLRKIGIPEYIIQAVKAISKNKGEPLESYCQRVKKNPLSRAVKFADIKHNTSPERLECLPPDKSAKLIAKYQKAKNALESSFLGDEDLVVSETIITSERGPSSLKAQPWGSMNLTNKSPEEIEKAFKVMLQYANSAYGEFNRLLTRAGNKKEYKILISIKPLSSFIDKVVGRGRKTETMADILRGAILTDTKEEAVEVVKNLKKFGKIVKYDYKELGEDPKFGYYGSHHVDIEVGGMIAEIQIMTKKLWNYKKAAHKIYKTLRTNQDAYSDSEIKAMVNRSRELFRMGNR